LSQIFLQDTHVLPKLFSYEEHCRRDTFTMIEDYLSNLHGRTNDVCLDIIRIVITQLRGPTLRRDRYEMGEKKPIPTGWFWREGAHFQT
jgi:hypothetical protein